MSFEPREYLLHMLSEAEYLVTTSRSITEQKFFDDPTLQRAFVRSLEIIGEATKKLPPDFRASHPEVEWRNIARMRDRLIHGYFSIDFELVWSVVRDRIPELKAALERILAQESA
jgi:uncharacterized protein with HEPN domain